MLSLERLKSIIDHNYFSLLILGLILCLRLMSLDSAPLSGDEPFSVFYAQQDISRFLPILLEGNNPPLYEFILHFWIKLFGVSTFAVRIPSVLFSVLSLWVLSKISDAYLGRIYTLSLLVVCGFSSFLHFYAQEARVYSLFILVVVWSAYNFLRLLNTEKKRNTQIMLMLSLSILLYTHYLGILVFIAFAFIFIFTKEARQLWIFAIPLLIFTPLLILFYSRFTDYSVSNSWVPTPTLDALYDNIRKFSNAPVPAVILLLLFITSFFKKDKKREQKVFQFFFLGIYIGMFLISFYKPIFLDRYVGFLLPFFYLSCFYGVKILEVRNQRLAGGLLIGLPLIMLFSFKGRPTVFTYNELITTIKETKGTNVTLVISPPWLDKTIIYQLDKALFEDWEHYEKKLEEKNIWPVYSIDEVPLDRLNDRLLVVCDKNGLNPDILSFEKYTKRKDQHFDKLRIVLFEKN